MATDGAQSSETERLREVVQDLYLAREAERELREEASALLRGLTAITEAANPTQVFEHLLAAVRTAFGFAAAFVLRVTAGGELEVEVTTDPAFAGAVFPSGKTFERTLRGRVSTLLSTAEVPEWRALPDALSARVRSAMYLPLQGESARAILVFTHPDERTFQPRHEQMARRFLPLLNQALRDADRRAQLTRANRDMRLVLDNVVQGLLTVDPRGVIVGERSAITDRWFGDIPAGTTLVELFARWSPDTAAALAARWSETELRVAALPRELRNAALELRLDYRPVPSLDAWQQVLVVITDVTAEVQRARLEAEAKDARRRNELSIAHHVQTSLLPRDLAVPGFEIAARMVPAEEVGGDYYDVIAVDDGCWLAIGDVSGHGLHAGLLMLMVQSSILTTTRGTVAPTPRDVVVAANRTLFENGRLRLREHDHMTLAVLRMTGDGTFAIAGAHDPPILQRAATGALELVETQGAWIGVRRDITAFTHAAHHRLAPGDTLWLYTDGVTEARAGQGVFGLERLCELLRAQPDASVHATCERVFAAVRAWSPTLADDATLLGVRYLGR